MLFWKVLRIVTWYGSIGTLTFVVMKVLGELADQRLRKWIFPDPIYYYEAWELVYAVQEWLSENQYATLASLATLCLAYSYRRDLPTVVDDQGTSEANRQMRGSEVGNNNLRSGHSNSQASRPHRTRVKTVEVSPLCTEPIIDSSQSVASVITERDTPITVLDECLNLMRCIQAEGQQMKEVVVALNARVRELEVWKKQSNNSVQYVPKEVGIYAGVNQENRKRSRRTELEAKKKLLTSTDVQKLIGKTKEDVLRDFREEIRTEVAGKKEQEFLTRDEIALGMKSLSELDVQWRKEKEMPVKDFHQRSIGVLSKEQSELKRREVIELIRMRRNEDFAQRMKEKGRPVARCSNCNQQFLVERGHRCYTAQWTVQAPKGPLPVERRIVISQTGSGAVQVKPVTRVDIDKLDNRLKRMNDYKLVHERSGQALESNDLQPRNSLNGRESKAGIDEIIVDEEQGDMCDVRVNQIEAQFLALIDETREGKLMEVAPFREEVKPHESPTNCRRG